MAMVYGGEFKEILILESGGILRQKDTVFTPGRTETDMKESGSNA